MDPEVDQHRPRRIKANQPNLRVNKMVMEPTDLDDFIEVMIQTFWAVSTIDVDALASFRANPGESLQMLGTRFNQIAMPLEGAKPLTSRMLALSLMKHLPDMVRVRTISNMEWQDQKREKRGELKTVRGELMA